MILSRRDFVHGGCAIAAATLAPSIVDRAEAGLMHRVAGAGGAGFALSGRNIINIDLMNQGDTDYAFIDHIRGGFNQAIGPINNSQWPLTVPTFGSLVDANGWPNNSSASGQSWGGFFYVPDPANFGGPYTVPFTGNGLFTFGFQNSLATWTVTGTTNCTAVDNGFGSLVINSSAGAGAGSVTFTVACNGSGPQQVVLGVSTTGSSGLFLKNIQFIRSADAADLAAGLIFRRAWKQPLVNLCPSAFRFMNVHNGNNAKNCRFENRSLPGLAGLATTSNWVSSPSYSSHVTGTNQMATTSAAVPTSTNLKTTPTSMQHGEIATLQFTSGLDRCVIGSDNQAVQVTGITNANPGVVMAGTATSPLSSLTWSGGVATGVMSGSSAQTGTSNWIVGDVIQLLIAGATQTGYNGNQTCTITAINPNVSTTFTYSLASNPGASPATGSPTWAGHGLNTGDQVVHYFSSSQFISATLNGTTSVTGLGGTSGLVNGMFVFGPGIPANTTITYSGTTGTLSNAATISGTVTLGAYSMKNLHQYPCKVVVTDATHYSLQTLAGANLDTTSFGTFNVGSGVRVCQYATLQVGTGGSAPWTRKAYPLLCSDGVTPITWFGGSSIVANDYNTVYFDKTICGQTDGSGNQILGAWMMGPQRNVSSQPFPVGFQGDYPIEICVALINELNAMSPAHTIGLWINMPIWGMLSMDADYSSSSNWAVNAYDVIMNPSSTNRVSGYNALGYTGATKNNSPVLIVELSNELWPSGANGDGEAYCINSGLNRWGNAILGYGNWQDYKALRSTCMVRDIKAASPPNLTQTRFVIGMFGFTGFAPGGFGSNYETAFGGNITTNPIFYGDWYTNDTLVTAGSWARPIDNHDGVAPAMYIDPPGPYVTATSAPSFTTDSALYALGGANQATAIANFVAAIVDAGGTYGAQQTTTYWAGTLLPQYASALPSGKIVVNYEGGPDWASLTGHNLIDDSTHIHVITSADSTFLQAVAVSSALGTAFVNFFNAANAIPKCYMPALYLWIGSPAGNYRWCYAAPDSYATIAGTPTEGAALTVNSGPAIAMSTRNQGLVN